MSAIFSALPASSSLRRARVLRAESHAVILRTALLAGSVAVGFAAAALAHPAALAGVEPELVFLLRGMALIKGGIALAALGLVLWRLGQPVSCGAAVGYLVGCWFLVAATVLIWSLSFIAAAAVTFHVAMFGLLALTWREGRSRWLPRVA